MLMVTPSNRRISARKVLRGPATVLLPGGTERVVRTWDIGVDGLSLVSPKPIPPGTYSLILYNVELNKENRRLHIGSDHSEGISCQIGLTVGVPIPAGQAVTPIQVKAVILRP